MNTRQIVRIYLEANKFDGLTDGYECGCWTGDLMPCGEFGYRCVPAYVHMGGAEDEFPGEPYYSTKKPEAAL
jgi:hypothetical protein